MEVDRRTFLAAIRQAYDHAREHLWYMEARMITVNDMWRTITNPNRPL